MKFNLAVILLTAYSANVLAGPVPANEQRDVAMPAVEARDAEAQPMPVVEARDAEPLPEADLEAREAEADPLLIGLGLKAAKWGGKKLFRAIWRATHHH